MLAAATVPIIKIRYVAKTPLFAIFGTRVICIIYVLQSISNELISNCQKYLWFKQQFQPIDAHSGQKRPDTLDVIFQVKAYFGK